MGLDVEIMVLRDKVDIIELYIQFTHKQIKLGNFENCHAAQLQKYLQQSKIALIFFEVSFPLELYFKQFEL